jgi:autotransporter-associated beta strand protein
VGGSNGTIKTHSDIHFGGEGQAAGSPYDLVLDMEQLSTATQGASATNLSQINLRFHGDYTMTSSAADGTVLAADGVNDNVMMQVLVDGGKSLAIDGSRSPITFRSGVNAAGTPDYPVATIRMAGGGTISMTGSVALVQNHRSRVAFGDVDDVHATTVNLNGPDVSISSYRLWIDHAVVNINGAFLDLKAQTGADALWPALVIGGAKDTGAVAAPSIFNINSGTVVALAYSSTAYTGVQFTTFTNSGKSSAADAPGGSLWLNGGNFIASDISVPAYTLGTQNAQLVFNGGTLTVSGSANTTAIRDFHLDNFINGFKGTETNRVFIAADGAVIDTGEITGLAANIRSTISGSGNFIMLGANTLLFSATHAYTGTTTVSSGTLRLGMADAIAASGAVVVSGEAVLDSDGISQKLQNIEGSGTLRLGSGVLTVENTADTVFAGEISNTGGLVKTGSATLTLSGSPGYDGGITINSGALALDEAHDRTYDGMLAGSGTFIKTGANMLTLGGGNQAFAGLMRIEAGRLQLADSLPDGAIVVGDATFLGSGTVAALTAAAGSVIQIGGDTSHGPEDAKILTVTGAFNAANARIKFDLFGSGTSDRLNAGSLVNGGGNIIDIALFASGTYNLGAGIGGLDGAAIYAGDVLLSAGGRRTAALADKGAYLELVTEEGASAALEWSGALNAKWNPSGSNWSGIADGIFIEGDKVTFNDGSSVRDVQVEAAVVASDMLVNTTGTYVFTGSAITTDADSVKKNAFSAEGKLTKQGTGVLVLNNGSNNFKGGVALAAGVIELGAGASFGGGTLAATGADVTLRAGGDTAMEAAIDLSTNGLIIDAGAHILTLNGTVSGANKLVKTGAGTLVLAAANTHAGVALGAGVVAVAHNDALGATLSATGGDATVRIAASGLDIGASIDLADKGIAIDSGTYSATWSGTLTGASTLLKSGGGTLTLSAANAGFTGTLALNEGAVRVADFAALGASTLAGAGTLDLDMTGDINLHGLSVSNFAGVVAVNAGADVTLDAGVGIALSAASLRLNTGATGTVAAATSLGGLDLNGGFIKIDMNDAGTAPENLLAVGHLTVTSGTVALDIDVSGAGELINPAPTPPSIFDQSMMTATKLIAADTVTGSGVRIALVDMNGAAFPTPVPATLKDQAGEVVGTVDYSHIAIGGGDGLYLGTGITAIEINAGKTLLLDNAISNGSTLGADIGGAGGVEIRATGTITLSGSNNFRGAASLAQGALLGTKANVLGDASSVALAQNTAFDTGGFDQSLRNLSGEGAITLGGATLTVETTTSSTFNGGIAATAGSRLVKQGAAPLTLGGDNSFSSLEVRAGDIRATHGRAVGAGPVSLPATSTLTFDGAEDIALTAGVTGGGRLAFNNSRGTLGGGNQVASITLADNSFITLAHAGALGGNNAVVSVNSGATLDIATFAITAGTVAVDGGVLRFGEPGRLAVQTLSFANGAALGLSGPLTSATYEVAVATNPITGLPGTVSSPDGRLSVRKDSTGKKLLASVINQSAMPSYEIGANFDAMIASMNTINARMTDNLYAPVIERKQSDMWLAGVGNFADYEQEYGQIGHTEEIHGAVAGYDTVLAKRYLVGGYISLGRGTVRTDNDSGTDSSFQFAGLYGAALWGRLGLGANIGIGGVHSESSRDEIAGRATGKYDSVFFGGNLELSYMLAKWDGGCFRPATRIYCMDVSMDDYSESGPGAVKVAGFSQTVMQTFVSLNATQSFAAPWGWACAADFSLSWRHTASGASSMFDVALLDDPNYWIKCQSDGYMKGGVIVGLGLRAAVSRISTIGFNYNYEAAQSLVRHTISATLRWMW